MTYRDEILAATIDAIAKSEHVYVTTAKLADILERALAEQRAAFVDTLDARYQTRKHSREVLDHYDHGFLDALLAAQDIAQPEGDEA